MFFYLVLLLSLSWPHLIGSQKADLQDEAKFDQIATASASVAQKTEKPGETEKEIRDQLIPSMIDTTILYENSNGFVPIIPSSEVGKSLETSNKTSLSFQKSNATWTNSQTDQGNSMESNEDDENVKTEESIEFEDDPVYSTEARIFLNLPQLSTNRRSFDFPDGQNEFELLKVKNDTPAVASYPDLYEDSQSSIENDNENAETSSIKWNNRERGKRLEGYVNNYEKDSKRNSNDDSFYNHYYSYNAQKDMKNVMAYEQEKVANNYHHQEAMKYNGHGQSKLSAPVALSLPRTKQEVNELTQTGTRNYNANYDNIASQSYDSPNRHRYAWPVIVAEPSNYKSNFNLDGQSSRTSNSNDYPTSRIIDSASSEVPHRYTIYDRESRYRSYEDSRDSSDDTDYVEYTERPKRVQKGRRRPYNTENSRRLPKEHRAPPDDSLEFENQSKRHNLSRSKSHRQRAKGSSWNDEDKKREQEESFEETRYDGRLTGSEIKSTKGQQNGQFKGVSTWNQVSPNIEISHSSGIEIDQLDKPKLIVPVKVNLVPVANFDHATALGNSQGFDVSNALLHNFVSATPVSTVTTPIPMVSTPETVIRQNIGLGNEPKNYHNTGFSVSSPDIIVGQHSFQGSMHPVASLPNEQSKFATNLRSQFISSTISPVFAVTPTMNPNLQAVSVNHAQGSVTPRPTYLATPSSNIHQMTPNQIQSHVPHLIVPQPTLQTFSNLVPVQQGTEYNIQVNPHGLQGQNLIRQGDFQVQNIPTVTPTPQTIPITTKMNLVTAESQSRQNLLPGSNGNILASASLTVGQNEQKQSVTDNTYYLPNQNTQQIIKPQTQDGVYQVYKNVNLVPKKTYIQTHLFPALLHPVPTVTAINANNQQLVPEQTNVQSTNFFVQQPRDQNQYIKVQNNGAFNPMHQLHYQLSRDQILKNVKVPSLTYQTVDNVGSHSSNNVNTFNASPGVPGMVENAHLPNVGTKNVEIVNPNIKPSPTDTSAVNSYETVHFPAAVLTTPIPMFTTTSFVTARPAIVSTTTAETVNLQNFVGSLTEMRSKGNQAPAVDLKTYPSQERPVFNPMNFIPSVEVIKSQNNLNSKLQTSEPLQQNLNLVPLMPGGNFFKPSFSSQSELVVKPKLNSDLEKYAEQMFKESLKTIYNSQKWNNDRRPSIRQNVSDTVDVSKLRNELQRLKASLSDSKQIKDLFEGHQSENKVRVTDSHNKKPDELLAALEQMLKSRPTDSTHSPHGHGRPSRKPNDHGKSTFTTSNGFKGNKPIKEFMTPPKPHSHRSNAQFHDKPGKKRPGSGPSRFKSQNHYNGPRSHSRPTVASKSANLETSESNVASIRAEPLRLDSSLYDSRHHTHYRKDSFDSHPFDMHSITTPSSASIKVSKGHQSSDGKEYDINHPRVHNLLGLLMKNKQLPPGNNESYFRDKDQLREFFEDEKRRLQQQFYDDSLRDYFLNASNRSMYSSRVPGIIEDRRFSSQKGTI